MRLAKLTAPTLLSILSIATSAATALDDLKLEKSITLSGLSSGAYMAGQYHLAFAEQVKGVAMIAAGPVYCAQNSLGLALEHCFNKDTSAPDLQAIAQYLSAQRDAGKLAPLAALADDKVWLFNGTKDQTVQPKLGAMLYQQYQSWVKQENITLINDKAFAHTFPTDRSDLGNCDVSETPYLASCGYDTAGALLAHLLDKVQTKSAATTGTLMKIDQHQLSEAAQSTLAETGYLYVPQSCAAGQNCQLHVSLHGCKQNADSIGEAYVSGTGLNNYADTNNIVVLYPQTRASNINPFNPNACWDWWGYTGADYTTNTGIQLQAIHQLVHALTD
ncbi:MAG TPA: PHB depolymerase family esterase [Rheinheimera sp.]|nr:PHB depolymerase family esterase [Rheinheimera sp.]